MLGKQPKKSRHTLVIFSTDMAMTGNCIEQSEGSGNSLESKLKYFYDSLDKSLVELKSKNISLKIRFVCVSIVATANHFEEQVDLRSLADSSARQHGMNRNTNQYFFHKLVSKYSNICSFVCIGNDAFQFEMELRREIQVSIKPTLCTIKFPGSEYSDCSVLLELLPQMLGSADIQHAGMQRAELYGSISRFEIDPTYIEGFGFKVRPPSLQGQEQLDESNFLTSERW